MAAARPPTPPPIIAMVSLMGEIGWLADSLIEKGFAEVSKLGVTMSADNSRFIKL